ncbi:MAG: molybdate transporter permease subunit [Actinomycetota bacterium]|nr:molybdate ABC transporter permease subunit [Ilumatobacteraceae bacterium]
MNDWFPLWLSLRVSLIATMVAGVVGVALAYLLAKWRSRWASVVEALVTLPIVLPPTVLGYYLLTLLGTRSALGGAWQSAFGSPLVFTESGAVVAATVSALPFVIRAARAAISNVDTRVEESARVMGLSEWSVARVVTLPLAARGIGAGVALGFARALGDFGATVMVAGNIPGQTQTLPVAVYDAVQAGDDAAARTGSLVLGAIAIVVLVLVTQVFGRRR